MEAFNLSESASMHHNASGVRRCLLRNISRISYADALAMQLDLHAKCAEKTIPAALLLLEHDPVITMGVKASCDNILLSEDALRAKRIEIVKTDRGGDVTYHGPGQLVGYPIIRLREFGSDLHGYLRTLEQSVIDVLAQFGLNGERHGQAGVWVSGKKVCSIGVAVRKWVTYHGFSLNVDPDLSHFGFINPCGINAENITSLARLLPAVPSMNAVREAYAESFSRNFDVKLEPWPEDLP